MDRRMQQAYAHCVALVREADRDRYLANLLVPEPARTHAFALHAFNAEVAAVRDRAREPLAGEIRLQWWRDALSGSAAGDAERNPVAAALIDTVERGRLPRDLLVALVDARRFDLYDEGMPSMAALEAYLRSTSSSLFDLLGRLLGDRSSPAASEAAGIAHGITGLLRAFPIHAGRGEIYLPADLLEQTGTQPEGIRAGTDSPALRAALSAMRGWASSRLSEAEKELATVSAAARAGYLPLALVRGYLGLMERSDYAPFRTPVELPQWRRQWTLWRAARRGPYR
jgi:15-cis-phytoene synthase